MSRVNPLNIFVLHRRPILKAVGWTIAALLLAAACMFAASWYKNLSLQIASTNLQTPRTVHIGSVLQYKVNVEAPFYRIPTGQVDVRLPEGLQKIDDHNITLKSIGFFTWTWQVTFPLQPFSTGTLEGGSADIFFTPSREGKDTDIRCKIPAVKVVSLLKEGERPHISSLPMIDTGTAAPPAWLYWLGMIIVGILVLGVLIVIFMRHGEGDKDLMAAHPGEDAQDKLEQLRKELPLTAEEFFVRLTDIVRQYLEAQLRMRATETTTNEFLHNINESNSLTEEQKAQLTSVLTGADLVKFAKADATHEQMEEALQKAEHLVEQLNVGFNHLQQ